MLSSKWTFSLTSLVIILVLAFVVPSAMAAEFGVSLSISDANDVSYEDGYQIERNPVVEGLRTTILVKTDKVVNYLPNDAADDILSTGLQYKHFIAIAYNKFGGATVIENIQGLEARNQGHKAPFLCLEDPLMVKIFNSISFCLEMRRMTS